MEKTMNKVELNGFIGVDPEVKIFENGTQMTRFVLATHDNYKNKDGAWVNNTDWHNVVVWGKNEGQNNVDFKKGLRIAVTGKIKNRMFTDKQGNRRYITEIVAILVMPVANAS
jgi:single-strand DNA-binding protein